MTTIRNTDWKSKCRTKLELELNQTEKVLQGYIVDADFRYRFVVKARRILAAVERFEAGTYGLCLVCKQEINHNRLLRYPYAEFCIDCQAKKEKRHTHLQYATYIS